MLEHPYDPIELSPVQQAFPADSLDYMPKHEVCESWLEEHSEAAWALELQRDWFARGIADIQLVPRDESWDQATVDRSFGHLKAIMGSFAPKHEHKVAAVAFLIAHWFSYVRWKPKGENEWSGNWPKDAP